jgi:hypothetical protein
MSHTQNHPINDGQENTASPITHEAARSPIRPKKKKRFILSIIFITLFLAVSFTGYDFYKSTYFATRDWKTYEAYDGSFEYPSNWKASFCSSNTKRVGFTLPGYIKADYIDGEKHQIFLEGISEAICKENRAVLATEILRKCPSYDYGEKDHTTKLSNGAYVQLSIYKDKVSHILIRYSECAHPIFSFNFDSVQYPDGPPDKDRYKYNGPEMPKEDFLKSAQYKDIVKFAESIELKN